ncbi:MAG TPA: molybdopterin-dependent oxidoreductase [Candidatus Limnocylindria bacterium]|nr:molybdopterin-dependent oxidoreductase [Candidatus Limnocylindria bacterium]
MLSDRRARTGLLLGAVAQFLALCTSFLASLFGFAFAPAALGQAVIEVLPGWISVPLIELLQFWAQRLLVATVIAGFLALGALAGVLALDPRRRTAAVIGAGAGPWLGAAALAALFASSQIPPTASLVGAGIGLTTFFGTLALLAEGAQESGLDDPDAITSPDRRRALLGAAALGVVAAVGGLAGGQPLRAIGAQAERVKQAARRLKHAETVPAADPAFDAVPEITPRLSPLNEHYTVDTALIDPRVDAARWRLEVGGAVESPFALSYEELLDLEAVEQLHTLECISNEIGGDLIGTALWTGVPLRDLLERARPRAGAFDVVLRSVDGYTDSIRIAKAMEPKTIVAYLMNGYTLPEQHGYPARLLVPNIYGMKNVKWLAKIEVVTNDFQGYWMERGWSDLAVVNTHSRIDTSYRVRWDGGQVALGGIANAGSRGISRVEISTDGGGRWSDAELEAPLGPLTWRRWRHLWTPPGTGKHTVLVRATDGEGQLQTATKRPPFPSGSTGYDSIELDVFRG